MTDIKKLRKKIFSKAISNERFSEIALEIFSYQYHNCSVYHQYVDMIGVDPAAVKTIYEIPFLPIQLFKSNKIITSEQEREPEIVFSSSSTTGMTPSKHFVLDTSMYLESVTLAFERFYGDPAEYIYLALLPSYLEREGSSLVYMMEWLISLSKSKESGFYLYDQEDMYYALRQFQDEGRKTILIGVTFALLDFAEKFQLLDSFPELIVIETGGMKGRGEELPREIVHDKIKKAFNINRVGSEYGMAELLSQAYSYEGGIFQSPAWMKILIRDFNNPFQYLPNNTQGAINIIDLANIHSCSFIETEDRGTKLSPNAFVVQGRISDSERRGCNMLIE